ncbi:MAG: glycoside hydrolase family 44 protein [Terracidiphilus sp.]|jgi:hypothetical protein
MGTSKAALLLIGAGLVIAAGLAFSFGKAAQAQAPTLSVDAGSGQHAINPNIYGIANYGLNVAFAQEIQVPNIRWGGDGTTRYNWQVDSSNSGFDWYFMGGNGETTPVPSASVDLMINTYKPASALITIPIIPYVNSTAAWTCSFPTSIYGAQQSTNPYVHPNGENCGNSLTTAGVQLTDSDILANHIPNTVSLQQGWVEHLVSTFGTAANGGVPFYQLDNEPGGWANTHRDIEPTEPPYGTIVSLGEQYATTIKQVDATAMVLGPSDFTLGGWIGNPSAQNNLYAGQFYLQQFAAYDKQNGTRSLDYFDEHYYPQFTTPATQLASTRTFWDPTYNGGTWVEQYYFDGPMQLIPRFHQWISQYYPGTKLSFSEYSIDSGNKLITDALAEADLLGIFGQQGLDFANMWTPPASTDPIAYAFRLFRNYDGQGSQFGSNGVSAVSSNPGNLSIYAAVRATDGALTIVVINKTTAAIETSVSLANYAAAGTAEVYSYSNANLTLITSQGSTPIVNNSISYTFPSYSATVFVVVSSQAAVLTLPTPGLSTKLAATAASFQWTAGAGVSEYQLSLGTTTGASDLYVYKGTATSTVVPTLPANGVTVYATLSSKINGAWQSNAYLYTESGTAAPAVLTSPTPGVGTVLGTTNVSFGWSAGTGVTEYQLNLSAIAPGDNDLFTYKGTATSAIASALPKNGIPVYARLYSYINAAWQYNDYVYTESGTSPGLLTSPTPGLGTVLGTTNVTFEWTTGAGGAVYQLNLSAIGPGGSDLFLYKGTATSATATTLPANGATVYATLYSNINGVWISNAYEYTESGTPTPATLQSPTPGLTTILGTSSVPFTWSSGGGATLYQLNLSATTKGAGDLYSYKGIATSATVPTLPANGVTVYATLYSLIKGAWQSNSYVYTESGSPTPGVLTSPTPGLSTILGTSNVLFQWSAGTSATLYQLNLSAIAPGDGDLYSYKGTALSATAPTLPANGGTVYARLYSYIDGTWLYTSYTYTASPAQ